MRLEWGHEDIAIPHAAKILDQPRGFGPCTTGVVVDSTGKLSAVLVFHNYQPEAGVIEVSAVGHDPRWAQRGILKEAFEYIFEQLGCQMAAARCAAENKPVRRLWKAMGATEHIIPRLRGRNQDEAILTLTDEAWAASKFAR